MKSDARKVWREWKQKLEAAGVQVSQLDKVGFGPALDAFAKSQETYDRTPGVNPGKVEKANKARVASAAVAIQKGQRYLHALDFLEKNSQGQQKKVLELATMWLAKEIIDLKKIK